MKTIPAPSDDGTCLITGASSGIGAEFARQMASRGYHVTLAARRLDRLSDLAAQIEREYDVRAVTVETDVTVASQRERLLASIAGRGEHVDVLINNAGGGGGGTFCDTDLEKQLFWIDLNVTALTALTHRVAMQMVERGNGAILNVASTAAMQPMPRMAVYAATKAYVLSLSQALNKELSGSGVRVTTLCPGPTRTEFLGAEQEGLERDVPDIVWQTAAECAHAGLAGMMKGKRVVIPKGINKVGAAAAKLSPTSASLDVINRFWPVGR